jgi:hypothetical protein
MSFNKFRTDMRESVKSAIGIPTSLTPEQQESRKLEQEAKKPLYNERQTRLLLEGCREIFLEHGLCGNIEIEQTRASKSWSISLDIDPDEEEEADIKASMTLELAEEKKDNQKHSITMASLRSRIKACQRRALIYKDKKYRKGLTIGQGFSITFPFISILSLSITIEMTVESLLGMKDEIEGGAEDGDSEDEDCGDHEGHNGAGVDDKVGKKGRANH